MLANKTIIGVIGKKRSGKSVLSKKLADKYNLCQIAFADKLRFILNKYFGIKLIKKEDENAEVKLNEIIKRSKQYSDIQLLYLLNKSINELFGKHIDYIHDKKNAYYVTYFISLLINIKSYDAVRKIFQFYATDICRSINEDIWVRKTDEKVKDILKGNKYNGVIIDDVRFENEADYIVNLGKENNINSVLIYVTKNNIPNDSHISENVEKLKDKVHYIYDVDLDCFYKNCSSDIEINI